MLNTLLSGSGDFKSALIELLLSLPIIFLVLSAHGAAQAFIANKLGDPTAKNFGCITLNPFKHIDPFGFISMVLVGFGWAHAVPIESRNFKKPRRDMALTSAAGPIANLILGIIFAILLKVATLFSPYLLYSNYFGGGKETFLSILFTFLMYGVVYNVSFAVLNLLPIPPFDGSRIFYIFLPPKYYFTIMKYEFYIQLAVLLLLVFGVLSPVINFFTSAIVNLIFFVLAIV